MALDFFHPTVASWFAQRYGKPTIIQASAWQDIAAGNHVLMSAPTGSGKTLAAFLYVVNQLISGQLETGSVRVLYISPLKALNNDIQRNLKQPLNELQRAFEACGLAHNDIKVATRSGDTPQSERRKMLRVPPEILITTPESLNIMLTSVSGRLLFQNLAVVIMDEVHSVFDNRRRVLLMSAVERLVDMSGEFQRLALSATINPFETVAEFMGGFTYDQEFDRYYPRKVKVIRDHSEKQYDMSIFYPEERSSDTIWEPLVTKALEIIKKNRSTLLFANARRLAETFTKRLNDAAGETLAYAHHGSMSREIREVVEEQFKAGNLKAIVATNTLEMGIDIGDLDEVLMVQSPNAISTGIQRLGRAGHAVGDTSKGTFLPTHAHDILEATALMAAIKEASTERLEPVRNSLDVLAQIIISTVAHTSCDLDDLYTQLKRTFSYQTLGRAEFDRVLEMLAGRYEDSRIRELKPRVSIDRIDNRVRLRPDAEQTIYSSGGVIPDRGYFKMRLGENGPVIGELDEEFVWENKKPGTTFTFGTQTWQVEKETHNDLIVSRSTGGKPAVPFWKGDGFNRSFHFSELIGELLERLNDEVDSGDCVNSLQSEFSMNQGAALALVDLLKAQKSATQCELPHRHHVVVEYIESGPGRAPVHQIILHNFWGNKINYSFSLVLKGAILDRYGSDIEVHPHNNCVVLVLMDEIDPEELMSLILASNIQDNLREQLEPSGFFGARFRECAGRALLVERRIDLCVGIGRTGWDPVESFRAVLGNCM